MRSILLKEKLRKIDGTTLLPNWLAREVKLAHFGANAFEISGIPHLCRELPWRQQRGFFAVPLEHEAFSTFRYVLTDLAAVQHNDG
ncbi:hypothetical protein DMI65_23005 [Escherichia coli]|nr:hypothetical protein [Escherichia coli]